MWQVVMCCYELALLALRGGMYEESERCLERANALDKRLRSGIMETRYNDGSHYTKDEHGRFTGSTGSGGGESGGSSGGGSSASSDSGGGQEGASGQSGDEAAYYAGLKDKLSAIKEKIKDKVTPEQYKEVSQEYLDSLPKLSEPESMEQALSAVNPKGYTSNCQRCVPAYEMRRRGYDVTAADIPANPLHDDIGFGDYKKVFVGAKWTTCQGTGQEEITDYLQKSGDNTTVEISINMGSSGHLFVGHKHNGQVIFVDPQTGKANAKDRFSRAVEGYTEYARIDGLKPSNLIKDCVEE